MGERWVPRGPNWAPYVVREWYRRHDQLAMAFALDPDQRRALLPVAQSLAKISHDMQHDENRFRWVR